MLVLKVPIRTQTLGTTVTRLCKVADIKGYKTNNSLRATATSRLYHLGVGEQLVMECTGHRSLEGVRSYKRTSDLSDILNGTKRAKLSDTTTENTLTAPAPLSGAAPSFLSSSQHFQQHQALDLQSATLNQCTVNFYMGSSASLTETPHKENTGH